MKKIKLKNEPIVYSEKALKYFQEMNDSEEFMTEPTNGNYIDYLLGDVSTNGHDGTTMDTEWADLSDDSDCFITTNPRENKSSDDCSPLILSFPMLRNR